MGFEGLKDIFSALSGDDEAGPKCEVGLHGGDVQDGEGGLRVQGLQRLQPDQDGAGDDEQKGWKNKPENKMFMKLFRYISGVNKEQEEVEMTVPVLSRMKMLDDGMVNKQMCFYLNKKHRANPPTPTDPAVKIEQNKEFTVYVHRFGGYAMS